MVGGKRFNLTFNEKENFHPNPPTHTFKLRVVIDCNQSDGLYVY
jgi:hypothetical protein